MNRRDAVTALLALGVTTRAAHAQPAGRIYRIGFLWDSAAVFPDAIDAFRQGLRDLGHVEGRGIAIEFR